MICVEPSKMLKVNASYLFYVTRKWSVTCLYVCRSRILQDIDRFISPDQVINRVVYDLDDTVAAFKSAYIGENSFLDNCDEQRFA